jgi:hypothetical protein
VNAVETLNAAAKKLRDLLADLDDNRGPWYVVNPGGYPQAIDNKGVPYLIANCFEAPDSTLPICNYITAMNPQVAVPLAAWLELQAMWLEQTTYVDGGGHFHRDCGNPLDEDGACDCFYHSLAIANAVLGETSEAEGEARA